MVGYVLKQLANLCLSVFDYVAYLLLSISYSVFDAVSKLNIFNTTGGAEIYEGFTQRIYTILSIVMIFVFAYKLILMIINPDGDGKKNSKLIKDTVVALVLIVIMPTIFRYLAIFQDHVLKDNTIPAIILNTSASSSSDSPARSLSIMTLTTFYHPTGSSFDTFVDANGYVAGTSPYSSDLNADITEAKKRCVENGGGAVSEEICGLYLDHLILWTVDNDNFVGNFKYPGAILFDTKLSGAINNGMDYYWIISTVVVVVIAWFFISYSIDLGTRAVKLAFLQLVAPIPVVLKIFPGADKSYGAWFKNIKKTYLEVFVRVAVIYFIVYLVTLIPSFMDAIFESNKANTNPLLAGAAMICLILGLLKFAKDVPKLFDEIFGGGDLLKGLNLKPNVRQRVYDNDYAMRGIGAIKGGASAAIGGAKNRIQAFNNDPANTGVDVRNAFGRLGAGVAGLTHGFRTGMVYGAKNKPSSFSDLRNVTIGAIQNEQNTSTIVGGIKKSIDDYKQGREDYRSTIKRTISGQGYTNAEYKTLSTIKDDLTKVDKILGHEIYDDRKKAAVELINKGEIAVVGDKRFMLGKTDKFNIAKQDLRSNGSCVVAGKEFKVNTQSEIAVNVATRMNGQVFDNINGQKVFDISAIEGDFNRRGFYNYNHMRYSSYDDLIKAIRNDGYVSSDEYSHQLYERQLRTVVDSIDSYSATINEYDSSALDKYFNELKVNETVRKMTNGDNQAITSEYIAKCITSLRDLSSSEISQLQKDFAKTINGGKQVGDPGYIQPESVDVVEELRKIGDRDRVWNVSKRDDFSTDEEYQAYLSSDEYKNSDEVRMAKMLQTFEKSVTSMKKYAQYAPEDKPASKPASGDKK